MMRRQRKHSHGLHWNRQPLEGSHIQGLHGCVTPSFPLLFRSPHPVLKFYNYKTRATGLFNPAGGVTGSKSELPG